MKYLADDLFFDLEIRGNFFVCTQYYPQPKRLVVSYMEQMQETNQDPIDQAPSNNKPWIKGFTQSYYNNNEKDYQIKDNQHAVKTFENDIKKTVTHFQNDVKIEFENLNKLNNFLKFAQRYGFADDDYDPAAHRKYGKYGILYDTDDEYNPNQNGLRIGYNSQNYDQTLIAHYIGDIMGEVIRDTVDKPEKAKESFYQAVINQNSGGVNGGDFGDPETLTTVNSQMFKEANNGGYMNNILHYRTPGNAIYRDWKRSNRFVDVSAMNPKHISLKRCAMALGYKIEESASNRNPTAELNSLQEMADVVAYNANDVYVTMKIFESPTYSNRFMQNKQLLKEFPYLIYQQAPIPAKSKLEYIEDQDHIRPDRLTVNSTSAKFVENVIAPYDNTKIKDNPTLNLIYPGPDVINRYLKANNLPELFHGKQQSMLDYIQALLDRDLKKVPDNVAKQVQAQYKKIKAYYQRFIGKNFNEEMDPENQDNNVSLSPEEADQFEDTKGLSKKDLSIRKQAIKETYRMLSQMSPEAFKKLTGVDRPTDFPPTLNNIKVSFDAMIAKHGYERFAKIKVKSNNKHNITFGDLVVPEPDQSGIIRIKSVKKSPYENVTSFKSMKGSLIVPYITPDGTYKDRHGVELKSYIVISVGGAHGVEVQYSPFHHDYQIYQNNIERLNETIKWFNELSNDEFKEIYQKNRPDDWHITTENLAQVITEMYPDEPLTHVKRKPLPFDETHTFGDLMTSSSSRKKPRLRKYKEPQLFKGSKVKENYAYTSSNASNHEDFDSYYPSLISNLEIFLNADGKDVFTEDLYHPRLHLKKIAKGKIKTKEDGTPYTEAEVASASLRQLSMKLLINSASGAGDATFSSKIKCNNKMLAMRIIGQLFCWYIGQSLALKNARVPSTNTDGLYTMNIDEKLNNEIVERCAQELLLGIGPEYLPLFVSKDANNRLERSKYAVVASARGGALTSWQGPSTDNAIDHPAIVDYILAQYLARVDDAVNKPFDKDAAVKFFKEFITNPPKFAKTDYDTLRFFQFPIVSNPKTARFAYSVNLKELAQADENHGINPGILNPTNRIFLAKKSASDTTIKMTGLGTIKPSAIKERLKERAKTMSISNEPIFRDIINTDFVARDVIEANLDKYSFSKLYNSKYDPKATETEKKPRDITTIKISNLKENQPVIIYNEDLHDIDHQTFKKIIFKELDFNAYLDIMQSKFENQWQNNIATAKA